MGRSGPLDVVAKALLCPTPWRPLLLTSRPQSAVRWVFNIEIWYKSSAIRPIKSATQLIRRWSTDRHRPGRLHPRSPCLWVGARSVGLDRTGAQAELDRRQGAAGPFSKAGNRNLGSLLAAAGSGAFLAGAETTDLRPRPPNTKSGRCRSGSTRPGGRPLGSGRRKARCRGRRRAGCGARG